MQKQKIKETRVYKTDVVLKSAAENELQENEYLFSSTHYDKYGNVIREIQYNTSGEATQEYVFKYNEKGFLVEEILQEEDGFIAEHKSFERDDEGKILREFRHYMDESCDTITYHYDNEGLLVKKETIDPDGDLESTEEFVYENGVLVRVIIKDEDGEILSDKKQSVNEQGKPIELLDYDASTGELRKSVNTYYPSGNKKEALVYTGNDQLIEKVMLKEDDKGQIIQVVEETLQRKNTTNFTYDERGNVIYQEEFDRNGEIVSHVKREFDEHNNLYTSQVFIDGSGRGLSRNYSLRQEYDFFEE